MAHLNSSAKKAASQHNRQPMKESNNIIYGPVPLAQQQRNRICSRSYTKITNENSIASDNSGNNTSLVGENELDNDGPKSPSLSKNSNANLNNIPMSKSVIVTSSDSSNYKRMTRSTISRQNSK